MTRLLPVILLLGIAMCGEVSADIQNTKPELNTSSSKELPIPEPPKTKKTKLTGEGRSPMEAEAEASRKATDISVTYKTLSSKTTGKGERWKCVIVIEYLKK